MAFYNWKIWGPLPWENCLVRSDHISMVELTYMTLAAISLERELRINDRTILLHLVQEENRRDVAEGCGREPSTKPSLFLVVRAMRFNKIGPALMNKSLATI